MSMSTSSQKDEVLLNRITEKDDDDICDVMMNMSRKQAEREQTEEWQKDNLEYDLRSTDWILQKARASSVYSQHIYAALCNNDFQKMDTWCILSDKEWSCSWRHAGGIIADMLQEGDYMDWYCSGIRGDASDVERDLSGLTDDQKDYIIATEKFVSESVITDEIRDDFKQLGWVVTTDDDAV